MARSLLHQGSNGANELYRNRGDGTFEQLNEIGDAANTGYGFGTATADVDADGDVDLFVSNLEKMCFSEMMVTGTSLM